MKNLFDVRTLGHCRIPSPLPLSTDLAEKNFHFVDDSTRIFSDITVPSSTEEERTSFEVAGPRSKIYFDPSKLKAGVVTCGGLCPGINNVIRALVMQLNYNYGIQKLIGFQYGYEGFIPKYKHGVIELTPESVKMIHYKGGSILHSSRGPQDPEEIVDCLERNDIKILFCIGGDGTLRGSHAISKEVQKRRLKMSVIGIPKTIDNDIAYCVKTFGFETAFSKAVESVTSAHAEAYGANFGVVIIKLMGRDSGFIAANTTLACPDVNFALIPEVPFNIKGENGLLACLHRSFAKKAKVGAHPHAVIVVAEGAGQYLMGNDGEEKDPSGNVRYKEIGKFLKEKIIDYFTGIYPVSVRLIEPSYLIRSLPANPHDSIFCYYLADHAAHAGMAGKTDVMIGYLNGRFIHVPLEKVCQEKKRIDPYSDFWRQVLFSTGQPMNMK